MAFDMDAVSFDWVTVHVPGGHRVTLPVTEACVTLDYLRSAYGFGSFGLDPQKGTATVRSPGDVPLYTYYVSNPLVD